MSSDPGDKYVRLGVDVGGTNTDAVAIDASRQHEASRGVLAHYKSPTTPDVTEGIEKAVRKVLENSALPASTIASLTVGTTHFINAVVEQDARRLLGLARIVKGFTGYCDGGLHIDGSEEAPVVEEQVIEHCAEIKKLGLTAVVISGVFSPIDEVFQQENRVRDIVLREIPGVDVVVSHEVANIGFLERENAGILNAAILRYAKRTVKGFRRAMKALNLTCPLYLTSNDGTLLDSKTASEVPIRTFSSGATNSMRGAAYLAGHDTLRSAVIVADIGGTTCDVGVLLPSGLPRQASAYTEVAGVRVNYAMPHLYSIGLGGGSVVRQLDNGKVTVGPDSVGHYLTRDARVFGGDVITATDIAAATGRADIGDKAAVQQLDGDFVDQAQDGIRKLLEGAIDTIKTSPEPLPVLLVGGGAVLAPTALTGASELTLPSFHDVANAVGAAVSKVGGSVDLIQSVANQSVLQAVEHAKSLAVQRATKAGAIKDTVIIAEVESLPVTYVANQLRTIVKAVGELDVTVQPPHFDDETDGDPNEEPEGVKEFSVKVDEPETVDPRLYRPTVVKNSQTGIDEWLITETDINYLADGCYVLGCAGGGSPAASRIQLVEMLRAGHTMRVVDATTPALESNATVYWGGHMGSPATSNERLQSLETVYAFRALMEYLNHDSFDAVLGLEIGGGNGLEPFLVGSSRFFDRPVLDADMMGRAYPTYWQNTMAVHRPNELTPCAVDSGDGTTIIMTKASSDELVDRALRASCAEMGSRVGKAAKPTTVDLVRKFSVLNTVSLAWRIGRCIARAEANNALSTVAESIVHEVGGTKSAKILFRGKVTSVERSLFKGHSYGSITIASLSAAEEDFTESNANRMPAVATEGTLKIPFKNENIYAEHTAVDGTKTVIASVPDLICVLDSGSGKSLGVPEFKYGNRVTVLGLACSPRWTETPAGLKIGGPKAFGYDIEYQPLGEFAQARSVIEEYATG